MLLLLLDCGHMLLLLAKMDTFIQSVIHHYLRLIKLMIRPSSWRSTIRHIKLLLRLSRLCLPQARLPKLLPHCRPLVLLHILTLLQEVLHRTLLLLLSGKLLILLLELRCEQTNQVCIIALHIGRLRGLVGIEHRACVV